MTKKTADKDIEYQEKEVRIRWGSVDDLPAFYCNQVYISHGAEDQFHLVFGHLSPPIGFDPSEYPDEIEIKGLIKLAVNPENMRRFVDAMSENLKRYEEQHQKADGGSNASTD